MRRNVWDWNYADEEQETGLYEAFPDIDKMIQICEGFISEAQLVPAENIKLFQQTWERLIHQLRPAYEAGRNSGQSYYGQPGNDPHDDPQPWYRPNVYLTAYKCASESLSTVESRWFAEGFHDAWEKIVGWD